MIDKVFLPSYNKGELGGVEMHPGLNKYMMQLRMESKEKENQGKPPITSPDVVQTADFVFSRIPHQEGDSGRLLLAKQKADRNKRYLVKHAYTDCACNEFIYTKLAQVMGYSMPDAVLFQNGVYYWGTILERDRSGAYLSKNTGAGQKLETLFCFLWLVQPYRRGRWR